MDFKFSLWKPRVDVAEVRFVESADLPQSGFASVYKFTKVDADAMGDSYKNFKGTVYHEELKLDADSETASEDCERRLQAQGVAYDKYTTGGRGAHYHIPRIVAPSHTLPAIDKLFVQVNYPLADTSFYHHVGWYRQVGAVHKKTGLKKTLMHRQSGQVLDMRTSQNAPPTVALPNTRKSGIQPVFSDDVLRRLTIPISKGNRHDHYINLGLRLDNLGQPIDWAFAYMANVNLMAEEPLTDSDMHRILNWVYHERVK